MNSKLFLSGLATFSVLAFVGAGCGASEDDADVSASATTEASGAVTQTMTMDGSFTLGDIAEHGSKKDCWMAIDGAVYDVTDYVNKHPGGNAIVEGCGKDATQLFATQGGEGSHSSNARNLLSDYEIGTLTQ